MKLMKRVTALFLCFLILTSGPISAFATEGVSDNDVVVETTTTTETEASCEECGGSDAHTDTCSLNTINTLNTEAPAETTQPTTAPTEAPTENTQPTTTPVETTGDTVSGNDAGCTECAQTEGHLNTCSQYVAPTEETTEPATTPTEETTEPTVSGNDVVGCTECGQTEGHLETCSQYVAPGCTECGETEGHLGTCSQYIDPNACAECKQVEGHAETCSQYEAPKDELSEITGPQVGDKIWIKSGSNVYKTQSNENGHRLLWNYEVEIVNVITDETGAVVWYEFKFASLGIGEIILRNYKYVHVDSTSVEEPAETEPADENACNCGEDAPENLADHADSCPRKQYVKTLFEGKTAEEIYAEWENYDEALRTDLLNMLQKWDNEKYEELEKLVDGTPDGEIEPGDAEAIVAGLNTLESELATLSYEDCDAFFEEMLDVYAHAFQNNYPLVSTEELIQIDAEFDALEEILLNEFGYVGVKNSAALSAASFGLRTSARASGSTGSESGVVVNKDVREGNENVSEFILTMEAYVAGEISQIEITAPSDIVLVLDQSASMYAPIGATKGYYDNTKTGANAFDNPPNAKAIELDQISTTKASQLGYYIARSNVPSHKYCTTCGGDGKINESTNCTNELYDWFVIHREDGKWKFYRVSYTSCPINDTDAWSGNYNQPAMSEVEGNLAADSLEELGINAYTVYQTQYGALYDAINAFVDSMSDVHRVAVVGFASSQGNADGSELTVGNQRGHGGTGIYVNGTFHPAYGENAKYSAAALNDYYASALSGNKVTILGNVNAVKTDYYGTNHDLGVALANKILENAPDYTVDGNVVDTNKVIILFTDGVPSGDDNNAVKVNTINYAAYAKTVDNAETEEVEGFGATVYSIWTSTLTGDNYGFLQSASSDNGAIAEPKYAIKVESADALSAAFQAAMQDTSSATITLEKATVLKDVLTQYFILPDELINKLGNQTGKDLQNLLKQYIKVYTSDYLGKNTWDTPEELEDAVITLEKDSSGVYRKINVTNFDYSANFVADLARAETAGGEANFYGRKLIVEIPIDPNPDFVGGDGVVTNTSESGIYTEDGNPVKPFPVPDVDVDVLKITPVFQSQDIYISQMANLATILNLGIFVGTDGASYIIDGINNAYANIVYTIEDPTGFTLTYTIPAGTAYSDMTNLGWSYHEEVGSIAPLLKEDTVYKATCVVTSTQNDENDSSAESQQTVRVFKPVITFRDSAIELGDTPDYVDNLVSAVWEWTGKDENNNSITLTATDKETDVEEGKVYLGTAPVLEYAYSPNAAAFTELNTPVAVTVTAKTNLGNIPIDQDITQYATFYRDACDFNGCGHMEKTLVPVVDDRVNFVVHLKNFDLTITKSGADSRDENQSFVFRVTGPDNFSMDVMVVGNGSVTIKGLPAGVYTVTELTDWSWRYTPDDDSKQASAADAVNGVTSVPFANTRVNEYWLSGDSFCENWWGGTNGAVMKRKASN